MGDMSKVIVPKSDQINADDLIGGPRTIRIREVKVSPETEQPVSIFYDGDNGKPFRPCKSMCRVMVNIWGPDSKTYAGKSMTLYRDPKVKWGGMEVGGIRISHMSDMENQVVMALTETRASRKPFTVKPLVVTPKTDRAAEGVRALIERIKAGEDVAVEPAVKEQREWLKKHRPELAAELDAAIAAQTDDNPFAEGPSTSQRGETTTLESALAEIRAAAPGDVDAIVNAHLPAFDEDDGATLRAAAIERLNEVAA